MFKQSGTQFSGVIALLLAALLLLTACPATTPATAPTTEATTENTNTATATTAAAQTETDTASDITDHTQTVTDTTAAAAASSALTFTIVPEGTEARYSIYELLMGQDKTVIGTTNAVEGTITVDPANPANSTMSPIRIDASTFATDSSRRDGAVRRWVLESNLAAYQYITFTPTALEGLPATVTIGEPFSFTVIGDLTIRDITNQERFVVTVTANSESELVGIGQTTIMRGPYNLTIPSVPSVANVAEEVPLEIEFTAVAR